MAMAYRASAAGGTNSANTDATVSITPALGDLLIVYSVEKGVAVPTSTLTDDRGGVYRAITSAAWSNGGNVGVLQLWVRESMVTLSDDPTLASLTATLAHTSGTSGIQLAIVAISGFSAFDGANGVVAKGAIRQQITATAASGAPPTASFPAVALTGNLTLSGVGCATNPPGLTAPTGATRRQDVGQATPVGLDVSTRDSGFTSTAIAWGTNMPSDGGIINVELDGNAKSPAGGIPFTPPTVVVQKGLPGWLGGRVQYLMPQRPRRESTMLVVLATQNVAKTIPVMMRGVGSDLGVDGLATSLVVQLKKFGGAYATITPTSITGRGGGVYDIALTSVHLDTLGMGALRVSLTTALPNTEMVAINDDTLIDVVVSAGTGDVNVVSMAANVLTASAIAANAITAGKIATDAIGAAQLAADAVTEIQSGLATSSALSSVQSDTDNIQTRLPAALVGGKMDSNVGSVSGGTIDANVTSWDGVAIGDDPDIRVDVTSWRGDLVPATNTSGVPIVDLGHIEGLLRRNSLLDGGEGFPSAQYDSQGVMILARLRVFADRTDAVSATAGAPNDADGETHRYTITGVNDGTGKLASMLMEANLEP